MSVGLQRRTNGMRDLRSILVQHFWGGTGVSLTGYDFPDAQNAGNVMGGWSGFVNFQPTWVTGTTVTQSSGSPPVVGYTVGTRVPISIGGGYNWRVW